MNEKAIPAMDECSQKHAGGQRQPSFSWRNYWLLVRVLLSSGSIADFWKAGEREKKFREQRSSENEVKKNKIGGNESDSNKQGQVNKKEAANRRQKKLPLQLKSARRELWQMLILIALFVIPLTVILFIMTTRIYRPFAAIGQVETLVFLLIFLMVVLGVIFSLPAIINSLYFGEDQNFLTALPVKPVELVAAKLSVVAFYEFILQSVLMAVILIALGYASLKIGGNQEGNWSFWVGAVVMELLLPIITLFLATIGALLLVRFTNFFSNQEKLHKYSGMISVSLVFIITFAFAAFGGMSETKIITFFESGQNAIINWLVIFFPYLQMLATGLVTGNIFAWLAGLLLVFVLGAIAFWLVQKFYIMATANLSEIQSSRRIVSWQQIARKSRVRAPATAYRRQEWLFVWRTPSFFNAAILINLLWPLIIWISLQGVNVSSVLDYFNWSNEVRIAILVLANLLFAFLIAGSNSIAATSISREGKNWFWLKSNPLTYTTQIWQKLLLAILVSLGGYSIFLIIVYPMLGLPILYFALTLALGFLAIVLTCSVGLIIDLWRPQFSFDETQNTIHQNYNNYLTMAVASFSALVVALVSIFLFQKNILNLSGLFVFWTLIIAGLSIWISSVVLHFGSRRLARIEGE